MIQNHHMILMLRWWKFSKSMYALNARFQGVDTSTLYPNYFSNINQYLNLDNSLYDLIYRLNVLILPENYSFHNFLDYFLEK